MKQLKQTIYEGLFDNIGIGPEHQIQEWIQQNFEVDMECVIIKEKNNTYIVDVEGDSVYNKSSDLKELTNGMFEWGEVYGFDCSNTKIKDLKGGPKACFNFDCSYCNNLISLEGAPQSITVFDCGHCKKLKSLKGLPKYNVVELYCSNCGKVFTDAEISKYKDN